MQKILDLKLFWVALYFSVFGITVFLGYTFYKQIELIAKHDVAIGQIVTYLQSNQPKQ